MMACRLMNLGRNVIAPAATRCQVREYCMEKRHHHRPVTTKQKSGAIRKAQYGGRHAVTMLPGGGIGPELMGYVTDIFSSTGVPVDFEVIDISPNTEGNDDLDYAITSIKRNGVAIKGNIETKDEGVETLSRNVAIRNELDLFVNVVDCKSYPGIPSHHNNIDIIVIRQNTEGEYALMEHEGVPGVVESMKVITRDNSERVARYAFEYAKRTGRGKVTTIHKANIMKLADGLFLETARRVAKDYPNIKHNDMIIDNCCMQLVSNPNQFEVMNLTNLYGSIVSNVICGLLGGAGLLSGKNYGDEFAVFEPGTRNTGTGIVGKNVANPVAMINASVDLLYHLGHNNYADAIRKAVHTTICTDNIRTPDLGGTNSTTDVIHNIKRILADHPVH